MGQFTLESRTCYGATCCKCGVTLGWFESEATARRILHEKGFRRERGKTYCPSCHYSSQTLIESCEYFPKELAEQLHQISMTRAGHFRAMEIQTEEIIAKVAHIAKKSKEATFELNNLVNVDPVSIIAMRVSLYNFRKQHTSQMVKLTNPHAMLSNITLSHNPHAIDLPMDKSTTPTELAGDPQ